MERSSQSPKEKPEVEGIDFTLVPKHELRLLAQKFIETMSIEKLLQLKAYAESELEKLPHSGMYSVEWDYWNYAYLIGDIIKALDTSGSDKKV